MSTFAQISDKYNHFSNKYVSIKINEKDITELGSIEVNKVSVTLTSGCEANVCKVDILDISRAKAKEDKIEFAEDMDNIKLGGKIEVFLGYGSEDKSECIYSGYIMSMETLIEENMNISYHLESLDQKVLMSSNKRSKQLSEPGEEKTKFSQAISAVLNEYEQFDLESPKVTESEDIEIIVEQYNESDYEFIVGVAQKLNYLFFISYEDGKATPNFISFADCNECVIELTPAADIEYLSIAVNLIGQLSSVVVRSNNEDDPEEGIESTVTLNDIDTIGSGTKVVSEISKKMVTSDMKSTIIEHSATTEEAAQSIGKAQLTKASMDLVTGEIQIVGIPEIRAGKLIELKGFSEMIDKQYFVKEVEHLVDKDGYKTICKIGANKL